ncbi:MAG: tRNA 5-methoxyuridine(34)/uridine 5-oxyacetic acid(34) synthase CmoB [Oscillatoriales cyanobacterium RM1_1_9]|nr:tRNA 5-methoxyuridine(34)/uridine 5-oxyacetic acid(34) synthase CmoB [Oscillatoriales cyanobacterium SM2_3_0]NJO47713.1 tRNA 5-methoxyuridine(34)/uridine 5-oxyacetic acid(34) synthase CmoB [Oscillatoriales cyanobacterium RM2_1_1]NJO72088.1 tRNA 5-methoxyuridine(34)/uridine 5-oxyacetic acid(34) synthase CmoB [Oscillatoriales cyanobacterium RM1_1_9]
MERLGYCSPDYLDRYDANFCRSAILQLRQKRQARLFDPRLKPFREAVQSVQTLRTQWFDFSSSVVQIGQSEELSSEQRQQFYQALRQFCPWKKGPFELFGISVDAEWRSDWKWQRILPEISSLKGRKIADIGCHNGYFMFRMLDQQPECIIGFEPYSRNFWNFKLIQNLIQNEQLTFELLGVEHIDFYPRFFDTVFCLGILYHHTDPIEILRKIHQALTPGGEIVVDCQGIPGELSVALTPRVRYAKARAIWLLPTQSCLENWLLRTGFTQIRCFFAQPLSVEEQRSTSWAEIESLQDFLNPNDPSLTVEGYPAPWRYYMIARK